VPLLSLLRLCVGSPLPPLPQPSPHWPLVRCPHATQPKRFAPISGADPEAYFVATSAHSTLAAALALRPLLPYDMSFHRLVSLLTAAPAPRPFSPLYVMTCCPLCPSSATALRPTCCLRPLSLCNMTRCPCLLLVTGINLRRELTPRADAAAAPAIGHIIVALNPRRCCVRCETPLLAY